MRAGWKRWGGWITLLLVFLLVGLGRSAMTAEGDTFWSIRAGDDILSQHTIFLHDTYSWTMAGRVWHPNSWLYDVFLSLGWSQGAWGLGIVIALGILLVGGSLALACRSMQTSSWALAMLSLLLSPLWVSWLAGRAQTVSDGMILLALLLAGRLLNSAGWRVYAWRLLGVVAFFALWANIHLAALSGLFALGGGVGALLLWAVMSGTEWRPILFKGFGLGVGVLVGCLCTPLGVGIFASASTTKQASDGFITEWEPLWKADSLGRVCWCVALVAILALGSLVRRRASSVLVLWLGASTTLLVMGVLLERFDPMALLVALPGAAGGLAESRLFVHPRVLRIVGAVCAGIGLILVDVGVGHLNQVGRPVPHAFPSRALVERIPSGCRTFNGYHDGGYIILLRGHDQVKVSVDGRNDFYGKTRFYQDLVDQEGKNPQEMNILQQQKVNCILVAPGDGVVRQALASGQWEEAAHDQERVLLERVGADSES